MAFVYDSLSGVPKLICRPGLARIREVSRMSTRFLRSAGTAAAIALFLAASVSGQTPRTKRTKPTADQPEGQQVVPKSKTVPKDWKVPRTPWGHPDLQGIYSNSTIVPLERPANVTKTELSDEEIKKRFQEHRGRMFATRSGDPGFYNEFWWEWGHDVKRTALIIDPPDAKLPWKPEAQARAKSAMQPGLPGSWLDLDMLDRCISRSLPGTMMPGFYGHYYQILQTPTHIALRMELLHDVRIIPLDNRPHVGKDIQQWLGDSRGHWEGDTLVVETTNMNSQLARTTATFFSVGSDLKLTERFKIVDPDTIDYQFTVDAPNEFTKPWTAAIPLWRTDEEIFEYACHEGNYAMPHTLSGARADEAAATTGKR